MSELTDVWEDRRVNIGYETAEELAKHYNPLNFRGHPENQRNATEESLDALGYVGAIKKSLQSGVVLDGHLRIELALAKDPSIRLPVDYYDLSPDEELLALQVLDAITEQAEPIADKLAALMERTRVMTADRPGLGAMLAALKAKAGINGNGQPAKDIDPQIDKAKELQKVWGTAFGQVWQLGNHRLAVGDCTDKVTVEAVMRGEEVGLLITDVPYDVAQAGRFESYDSDLSKASEFRHFDEGFDPRPFLDMFFSVMPTSANWFIFVGALFMGTPVYTFLYDKCDVCSAWIYIKKFAQHNVRGVGFAKAYELAIYAWNQGHYFDPLFGVDGYDYGLYSNNEGGRSYDHPTSKPLAMFERLVKQLSAESSIVIDPFVGSGSTIIAGENLGRKVRAIEIDPGYAAVSIQRYFDLTKIEPRLISG